jgi:hypothetical protein
MDIALFRDALAAFAIPLRTGRRPRREPIHIAVEHAEGRRDQHSVVNISVGGAFCPRRLYVGRSYLLAAGLYFLRNTE